MSEAFEQAISDEATRIVVRTQRGLDVDGNPFPEYSKQYAKVRRNAGRRTSPVDLTFTGQMLNSIQTRVTRALGKITGEIFFSSASEAAKARGNQKLRSFFGLSDEQVERIKDKMQKAK